MGGWTKLPLVERLQSVGTTAPNFLAAFELFATDFRDGLEELTLNSRFATTYNTTIALYSYRTKGGKNVELLLSEVVSVVMDLPPAERGKVLYKLLVEPFARLYDCEKGVNNL